MVALYCTPFGYAKPFSLGEPLIGTGTHIRDTPVLGVQDRDVVLGRAVLGYGVEAVTEGDVGAASGFQAGFYPVMTASSPLR